MGLFKFEDTKKLGMVESVDTSNVIVRVDKTDILSSLQVNYLVVLRASKLGQNLIGIVNKITRKNTVIDENLELQECYTDDFVKINLIGTLLDKDGTDANVFKRTLESVPEINSDCFIMDSGDLTKFMSVISRSNKLTANPLRIGTYSIDKNAVALLDGNKFFQRHAVITGSTGSGKSYTVATLVEQIAKLPSANAIVFDIHGEYGPLNGEGIIHYKIAGPSDKVKDDILFLPYWLLSYDEMISLMLDRSDNNAPNQAMLFSRLVVEGKKEYLEDKGENKLANLFTIDSPIPYDLNILITRLNDLDNQTVPGANGKTKQGDFYNKLARFIQRLEAKKNDRRLNFMFSNDAKMAEKDYFNELCNKLMAAYSNGGGVKIIDFSEVPSDILPLIVSLIARLIFSVQQWVEADKIHPIALFCDEAHLYIPEVVHQGVESSSLLSFERIAKEGRKYGVGLVVISQRPADVNRTILSQSSNFIAMRLTNADDQNVVKKLLPDSLGNYADLLPILDVGEAIIVGDASLLPCRIVIDPPSQEPKSATVKFWDEWMKISVNGGINNAVEALRRQTK